MKHILFLLCLLIGLHAGATTFYVATTGNDNNPGTLNSPLKTPKKALELAQAGDIIELRQGTYPSDELRVNVSNLTMRSYAGEWAILQAPLNVEDITFCIWYHEPDINGGLLENLEIRGGYLYGIFFETNWDYGLPMAERHGVRNITIRNCKIHDTGRDCVKLTPLSENITLESCSIYNSGVGPSNDPNDPNAEGIDCVNGINIQVKNCHIYNTSTSGLYFKGGSKNCLAEGNLLRNTGEAGIILGFYTDAEYFNNIENPQYYECLNSVARNNIVINTGGLGIGFFGAKDCEASFNTVKTASPKYHAPLYFSPAEVWINDNLTLHPNNVNVRCMNNIFIDDSGNGDEDFTAIVRDNCLNGNNLIKNNLYYKGSGPAQFDDGNWPAKTFTEWKNIFGIDQNSIEANPNLGADFHLTAASPAVDHGINTGGTVKDYDNATRSGTPDIGADELNQGTALPVPPPANVIGTGAVNGTSGIFSPVQQSTLLQMRAVWVDNSLQIDLKYTQAGPASLFWSTAGGQMEQIYQGMLSGSSSQFRIPMQSLPAGIYFLTLQTPEGVKTLKLTHF